MHWLLITPYISRIGLWYIFTAGLVSSAAIYSQMHWT
eukprot:UN10899